MQVPQTENYTEFGKGTLIGSGADFAAGAAGSLLEQAISGERMNAGRGILGGLSNAVSGAIFGNVPFKNAGQAFGKGALSGAATSGLGYLSDLVGRQPKSGQMRHFPGGTVARTPYERLTDPRGICVQQDIFGGGRPLVQSCGPGPGPVGYCHAGKPALCHDPFCGRRPFPNGFVSARAVQPGGRVSGY